MSVSPSLRALTIPDFRALLLTRFANTLSFQMPGIAMQWYVYDRTGDPMLLAFVGLAQFLPSLLFTLPAGHVADSYDRRNVLRVAYFVMLLATLIFGYIVHLGYVWPIFVLLFFLGTARAFAGPASFALVPAIVPLEDFPRAVALNSIVWQAATIAGPVIGGWTYALRGRPVAIGIATIDLGDVVFWIASALSLVALISISTLKFSQKVQKKAVSLAEVFEGLRFVFSEKLILATISLDLFAVLFGGATALLPMYAKDILHIGAEGLGWLRSAPAIGASCTALFLTFFPLKRHVGRQLLVFVFGFGLATIVFGFSRDFVVSLVALFATGAFDMVSVVLRGQMIQLGTPDAMRGRVSAVNQVFIGASNELGEFESGAVAKAFGAIFSVVFGGVVTCLVVVSWAAMFPRLRKLDRVESLQTHAQ